MAKKKSLKTLIKETEERSSEFGMYQVNDSSNPVLLDLFPGATGQSAVTTIQLEKTTLLKEAVGSLENFEVGKNNALNGLEMTIYTLVTDVSTDTDLTSLDMTLRGGVADYSIHLKRTVQSQGDSVGYEISILFYQ